MKIMSIASKLLGTLLCGLSCASFAQGSLTNKHHQGSPLLNCSQPDYYEPRNLPGYNVDFAICDESGEAVLSRKISGDNSPNQWETIDRIRVGLVPKGYQFGKLTTCYTDKPKKTVEWMAVYRIRPKQTNTWAKGDIAMAWSIDPTRQRFMALSPTQLKQVICEDEVD